MALFAAGQRVTASALNNALPIHCGVTASAFSLPSSASAYTAVAFTAQTSSNTTGMWALASPTRLIAPTAGTYDISGVVTWPATLATSDGRGEFRVNGSSTAITTGKVGIVRGSAGNATGVASGSVVLAAGDYLELYVNQGSGSTCSLIVALTLTRISTATA